MRLLIVKLHALGDLVIATPAIRRLRSALPKARIDLLTTEWTAPAVQGNECLDEIIAISDAIFYRPGVGTAFPTLKLLLDLNRRKYDAAVAFHRSPMVSRFLALAGISQRFRFNGGGDGYSVLLDEVRHSALTACELADLASLRLGGASLPPPELSAMRYEWHVTDGELSEAKSVMQQHGVQGQFVAIYPGGGVNPNVTDLARRWPEQGFATMIDCLRSEVKLPAILLGGISDATVCQQVRDAAKSKPVNLAGRLPVRLSAALTSLARLAICNDSGPLHIAAAVGTPTVGIFGPTGPRLKKPPGPASFSVSLGMPCSPCYFTKFAGCIFNDIPCLRNLSVELVMISAREALNAAVGVR